LDEVIREAAGGVVGRPHIARVLVRRRIVDSTQEAFTRFLAAGAPAYVDKDRLEPQEAIDALHAAGAVAVLAHPVQLRCADDTDLRRTIQGLVDLGLDGIETIHSDHDLAMVQALDRLAN